MSSAAVGRNGPYRQIVAIWRARWDRYGDALVAVALFVLAEAEVGARGIDHHVTWLVRLVVVTLGTLPLAWRRSDPTRAFVLLAIADSLATMAGGNADTFYAIVLVIVIALYSGGAYVARHSFIVPVVGLASFWADDAKAHHAFQEYFASATLVLGPWLAGRAIRYHRQQAAQLRQLAADLAAERERAEQSAAEAERGRIAREMHDVVAHALSVIAIQADAAGAALAVRPELAAPAVETIRSVTTESLDELRRVLRVIHDDERSASPPTLRGLARLVARVQGGSLDPALDVTVEVRGSVDQLPAALDLAAYRIVQEALTNVRKHSDAGTARVIVERNATELAVTVESDGPARAVPVQPGSGQGLRGLRERVAAYDGTFRAGPYDDGWRVAAVLPMPAAVGS